MNKFKLAFIASAALALCAHGQTTQGNAGDVAESTDPAKAAAIEQEARDMQARAATQPDSSANIVDGRTEGGMAFLSGGITVGDRVSMHAERERYSLWVATVAKPSGAYLADAKLRIVNLRDKAVVLEKTMDGPWLFAALPAGGYEVSATFRADGSDKDQTLTDRVTIPARGQRQVVLRFTSQARVDPEMNGPFQGNPFDKPISLK